MEDAHAAILDLEGPDETPNSFFAVYDGHGGRSQFALLCLSHPRSPGSTVAKFAGQNVHKRLVTEESYKQKDYAAALKKAFLGTDEDLLASKSTVAPSVSRSQPFFLSVRSCTHSRPLRLHGRCRPHHFG